MKYYATWSANNGSTKQINVEFSSKAKAIAYAKECCKGNHFQQACNSSNCNVVDEKGKVWFVATLENTAKRFNILYKE